MNENENENEKIKEILYYNKKYFPLRLFFIF